MASLSTPLLVTVFLGASLATWIAGVVLSSTTDELDNRLGLGAALGGMILLAIAGSLPELVITVTATLQGNLGLAARRGPQLLGLLTGAQEAGGGQPVGELRHGRDGTSSP